MLIEKILTLQCVRANFDCLSRKKVLELISKIAASRLDDDPQQLFERLYARERLGSTGIGNQVAIPHCASKKANEMIAVLVTLSNPVDFSALDNIPVDVFFALFYPLGSEVYYDCLEEISKILDDKELVKLLKSATSDADLYDKIVRRA